MHQLVKFVLIFTIFTLSDSAYVQSTPAAVTLPTKPTTREVTSQFWGKWNGNGKIVTPLEDSQIIQQTPVLSYVNEQPNFQHFGVYQVPSEIQYNSLPYHSNLDYSSHFMMPFNDYMNNQYQYQGHYYPYNANEFVYNYNW